MISPLKPLLRSKSIESIEFAKDKFEAKEKFSRLLLTRCMKIFDFCNPNIRIAEEIVNFVNRVGVTESDLKEFDDKIKNIVNEIKKTSDTTINAVKENEESQPIMINHNEEKVNPRTNTFSESIKLPKLISKSVCGSTARPDSRNSKASKMSGASKLSQFSDIDAHNYQIKQWLRSKVPDNSINNQQNLPYDINDYDSMVKYDVMLFNEEVKKRKQSKMDLKNLIKKDLEDQIQEKKSNELELIKKDNEIEEYLNGSFIDTYKEDIERKEMLKNSYKMDLDNIFKDEALKRNEAIKLEKKYDNELGIYKFLYSQRIH